MCYNLINSFTILCYIISRFPCDPVRKKKWADSIGLNVEALKPYTKICSSHFPEKMFDITERGFRRLRHDAVPCVCINYSCMHNCSSFSMKNSLYNNDKYFSL